MEELLGRGLDPGRLIQPFSVDSEEGGEPPGGAASLGLCGEIHHARTRRAAGRQCGSVSLPSAALLFLLSFFFSFPPLIFFFFFFFYQLHAVCSSLKTQRMNKWFGQHENPRGSGKGAVAAREGPFIGCWPRCLVLGQTALKRPMSKEEASGRVYY